MPQFRLALEAPERRRAARLARRLFSAEPALGYPPCQDTRVHAALGPGPRLCIEDHSWIRLFETAGDQAYSYRALLLAGDGDLVALGVPRSPAFESYCRDRLGLGAPQILAPVRGAPRVSLARCCLQDPAFVEAAAGRAREAGGLTLLPYMGTGGVWRLASAIAAAADVKVAVAAPPPLLTRRVNDKLWFAQRVEEILGREAAPPQAGVFSVAALIARLLLLARRSPRVGVRLVDSASSAGMVVLDAAELEGRTLHELRGLILQRLRRAGWRGDYPLLAAAWEAPVLASPSTHLWIPPPETGDPICEGVFDQQLIGSVREFVGASPSLLPQEVQERLAEEALRIGAVLQRLGYLGRCSFDAIVLGDAGGQVRVHWVECNGRWGGVSLPLTLANRLTGNWARHPFTVLEEAHLQQAPRCFADALASLDDLLYCTGTHSGVVLLSPSRLELGSGFELFAIGDCVADARRRALAAARRLTA